MGIPIDELLEAVVTRRKPRRLAVVVEAKNGFIVIMPRGEIYVSTDLDDALLGVKGEFLECEKKDS